MAKHLLSAATLLRTGSRIAFSRRYRSFLRALNDPMRTQRNLLRELLRAHEQTEYGRSLGLSRKMTASEFREAIPLNDFDQGDLTSWIQAQQFRPKDSVLSPGGVRIFEKTSGSSGRQKLIPYNRLLMGSFERYFTIWLHDLLNHGPRLDTLRVYMSISPSFRTQEELKARIGLEDDSEYLSPLMRTILRRFLVAPLDLKTIADPNQFRDLICAHLAGDPRLEILSLWHPSLFKVLWDHLKDHRARIGQMLLNGDHVPRNPQVAALLRSDAPLDPVALWPDLKLVSSWEAANSAIAAAELRKILPHAAFQAKGLLATEAPMTLPLISRGNVPFLTDVLFEFCDDQGKLHWIDELQDRRTYTLIISQKGGLLRYKIRDQVRVEFSSQATPSLEFIGREGETSDLVGEKLTSEFLNSHQPEFMECFGPTIYTTMPRMRTGEPPYYVLLADGDFEGPDPALAAWWEERIRSAYHYDYARRLGQLASLRAYRVPRLERRLIDFYSNDLGMKTGNIKLSALLKDPELSERILARLDVRREASS